MTPEQVLSHPPRVLTQAQREFYFSEGYLLLPEILPAEWIARLRAATDEMVERSRKVTKPDKVWDLEPGHSAATPRLRRVSAPVDQHPAYWDYVLAVAARRTSSPTSSGRTSSSTTPSSTSSGRAAARR